jgi:hypothetical protein
MDKTTVQKRMNQNLLRRIRLTKRKRGSLTTSVKNPKNKPIKWKKKKKNLKNFLHSNFNKNQDLNTHPLKDRKNKTKMNTKWSSRSLHLKSREEKHKAFTRIMTFMVSRTKSVDQAGKE